MRAIVRRRASWTLAAALAFLPQSCASFGGGAPRGATVWAFAAPWDPRSEASIAAHAGALDAVVTGWIALDSASGRPLELFPDRTELPPGVARYVLVTSWLGDRFHPAVIRALARAPEQLAHTAGTIARQAGAGGYTAMIIDFEEHDAADFGALATVTRAIADSARARGVDFVAMAVPATDTSAYPAAPLLRIVDRLVVMLYDEHWSRSEPGPVASPQWVRLAMGIRMGEVGASRLIAALPLYGYRWARDSTAITIGWDEAVRAASSAGITLSREPATQTVRARTSEWEIWIADAQLVDSLMTDLENVGVRQFAFWRLGTEDPRVWPVIQRR